jgi:hypothetical protein
MLHKFVMVFKCFLGVFASVLDVCFKCFIYLLLYVVTIAYEYLKSRSGVAHGIRVGAVGGASNVRGDASDVWGRHRPAVRATCWECSLARYAGTTSPIFYTLRFN